MGGLFGLPGIISKTSGANPFTIHLRFSVSTVLPGMDGWKGGNTSIGIPPKLLKFHDVLPTQEEFLINPNHNLYPNKTIFTRYKPAHPFKVR
jgi:hypothetical protein